MLRHFLITHLGKISLHVKNLQNYKSTFSRILPIVSCYKVGIDVFRLDKYEFQKI